MGPSGSIFEGKTLDDAVRKGLDALGLSRAEVMITMLEEGSGGFLGLGARPYKVRVMPRPGGAPHEPEARGDRDGRSRRDRDRGRSGRGPRGGRDERRAAPAAGGDRPPRHEARSEDRRGTRGRAPEGERAPRADARPTEEVRPPRAADDSRAPRSAERAESGDAAPGDAGERRRRRGRRGGRGRGRENGEREGAMAREDRPRESRPGAAVADAGEAPQPRAESSMEDAPRDVAPRAPRDLAPRTPRDAAPREDSFEGPMISSAELEAEGKRWTEQFLAAMGFEATVTATAADGRVDVTAVVPKDDELLAGRKGEVRQALQHLLNRMINRGEGSRYHLQLEINDFWKRREEELHSIARQLAEDAVANGTESVSEYLNAQERRIIHVALREDTRVKTYALGTGMIKRLAVAPADYPEGPSDDE